MNRIAILGASGFVGSTLAEELVSENVPVRCLIHSAGNAWRLSRHGMDLQLVDLMDPASIRHALNGCSHVVNCSRGGGLVMIQGMKNLMDVCRELRPERFVHISSVAVYGNEFSVDEISESHPTHPEKDSYGWKKLKQDEMVQRAARQGLSAAILCPPNISGPYSMFWEEICKALQSKSFAFVEEGRLPCPLVDVGNLVQAIRLALKAESTTANRVFICDRPTATWQQVISGLARVMQIDSPIPSMCLSEAAQLVESQNPPKGSIKKSVGHLISSGVRESLRKDPYIGNLEKFAVGWAKRLPNSIQNRLRNAGPKSLPKVRSTSSVSVRLLAQQLRNVSYSSDAAKKTLAFEPQISLETSFERFEEFARLHWGLGSPSYELLSELN